MLRTSLTTILLTFGMVLAMTGAVQAQEIPDITLAQLEDLVSQSKGKVLVVDFFATWCPPCRQEIPGFVELQKKYSAQGLSIVGISVDEGPVNAVQNFAKEMGINYQLYHDTGQIARKYRIRAIPTTYVYDKAGNKVKTHIGFVSPEEFDKQVSALL